MNFEDLKNPELQEKLKFAETPEKLLELAREEGYELTDDVLDGISGGWCMVDCNNDTCATDNCFDF